MSKQRNNGNGAKNENIITNSQVIMFIAFAWLKFNSPDTITN